MIEKKPRKMSTYNQLDLETLGYWPTMPKTSWALNPTPPYSLYILAGLSLITLESGGRAACMENSP